MPQVFAICPFCNKNIMVNNEPLIENNCSSCGQILTAKILNENDSFIDINASNAEYTNAKLYFDNADFRGAGEYFKKSLEHNRNNYLANYYYSLCEIYENDIREDFDVPKELMITLKTSIDKLENSSVPLQYRISFLNSILNEIYIMLLSHYNKLCTEFNTLDNKPLFRLKIMQFLSAINIMHSIDKERMLVFENTIAGSLIGITDLAVGACFNVTNTTMLSFNHIDTCSDNEFSQVRSYYVNFIAYATSLDLKYSPNSHKVDYTDNLEYNKEILLLIDKYYSLNRDNSKNHLSITGEFLDSMITQCLNAVKMTYYTCVRNLNSKNSDSERIAIINQGIFICFEALRPRLYIDGSKRVNSVQTSLPVIKNIAGYLNAMMQNVPDGVKKTAGEILNDFYQNVYEMIKIYYSIVLKNYSKVINKLKKIQNDEFAYYQNFLFTMSLACSVALIDVISFTKHKSKHRLNLLKLCKEICEEFFLVCDYKIELIEKSPKYADIIKIYGELDGDIEYLNKNR